MKKPCLFFLAILMSLSLSAQTQYGYVKTKGRLGSNGSVIHGTRLSGATVLLKGRQAVVSNANGTFSFPIPGRKFYLLNVSKTGYILTDPEALSRSYSYSSNPLVIVLETATSQSDDKLAAERKIRRTLQRELTKKEDEIEELKAQNKLTEEQYREQLQELYSQQQDNEKLISNMAERYAQIDYDQIDEFNRRVSDYILNGELTRADSLLNTHGDILSEISSVQQEKAAVARRKEEIAKEQQNVEKAETGVNAKIEDLARRCYSKFEIFRMRHQNDSAACYIEQRAALDTTNVLWLLQAGSFIDDYIADYDKAIEYYRRALRQATLSEGQLSNNVAICLNNIGRVYNTQGNYDGALECFTKALAIQRNLFGENHSAVAVSYNNIGSVYVSQSQYDKALEYYNKAMSIRKAVLGENNTDVAMSYNNIGTLYTHQAQYSKALEYFNKSLEIRVNTYGEKHPDVAMSYNNIGSVCASIGSYTEALEYYKKSASISKEVFGEDHPDVATTYNNIGYVYHCLGNNAEAMEYYHEAMNIRKKIFGENNPDVALIYNNIGTIYDDEGDHTLSLECYHKALTIQKAVFGETHPNVAMTYNNIGYAYSVQGNYPKALEYYTKALAIQQNIFGERHPNVALCYNNIGYIYDCQDKYAEALQYYCKALSIRKSIFNVNHPDIAISCRNIYGVYCAWMKTDAGNDSVAEAFDDFMTECAVAASIIDGGVAEKEGLTGEYYMLEYGDWTIDSHSSFADKGRELQGKPKDIVILKDGIISKHHFEDAVGASLSLKYVGKEEKQKIVAAYHKWKEANL